MFFFFFEKPRITINIKVGDYNKRGTALEKSRPQHTLGFAKGTPEKRKLQQEPSGTLSTTKPRPSPSSAVAAGEKEDGIATIPVLRRYHRSPAPLWTSIEGYCKQQRHSLWGSSAGETPRHSTALGPAAFRRRRRGRTPSPQPSHRSSRSREAAAWTKPAHAADHLQYLSPPIPERDWRQAAAGAADRGEQNPPAAAP
jgi:hypothetical protein